MYSAPSLIKLPLDCIQRALAEPSPASEVNLTLRHVIRSQVYRWSCQGSPHCLAQCPLGQSKCQHYRGGNWSIPPTRQAPDTGRSACQSRNNSSTAASSMLWFSWVTHRGIWAGPQFGIRGIKVPSGPQRPVPAVDARLLCRLCPASGGIRPAACVLAARGDDLAIVRPRAGPPGHRLQRGRHGRRLPDGA